MIAKSISIPRVLLAFSAVFLLAASWSTASADAAQWYTGTTETNGTVLTGNEPLATVLASENKQSFKTGNPGWKGLHLVWTVWTQQLVTEISGVECLGCSIRNTAGDAIGEGKLRFTGAKLYGSTGCTVEGSQGEPPGVLTTTRLEWKLTTLKGKQYVVFTPAGGGYGTVIQLRLAGCTPEGGYNLMGGLAAEPTAPGATSPWSQAAKKHGLSFSKEVQEASGVPFTSEKPSWIEGSLVDSLPSSKYWNAK